LVGVLIAIEGIDGAGKATLTDALAHQLAADIAAPHRIAFPRYGHLPFGVMVERALNGDDPTLLDSVTAMSVAYASDRWQYWHVDRHATAAGAASRRDTPILIDRWCASNAAYGSARLVPDGEMVSGPAADFRDWVAELEFGQMDLPRPTLTVLLATDDSLARERRAGRDASDAYEADLGLQGRALAAYRAMATAHWGGPWVTVDPLETNGSRKLPATLAAEVMAALTAR
jgi:dTMP kinase